MGMPRGTSADVQTQGCFLVGGEREWHPIKSDANKHQVTKDLVSHNTVFIYQSSEERLLFLLLLLLFN